MIFNLDKREHLTVSNICTELTPIVFTKCLIQNNVVIINHYLSWGDHIGAVTHKANGVATCVHAFLQRN